MLPVNEYFDGKVKSIALQTDHQPATVGVMSAGQYQFSTSQQEVMTVVSGTMTVRLPTADNWQTFAQGESFTIAANVSFDVEVTGDTAYFCRYG